MAGIDFMKVNVRVQSNGGTEEVGYVRTGRPLRSDEGRLVLRRRPGHRRRCLPRA
jgi:hypothetical protein